MLTNRLALKAAGILMLLSMAATPAMAGHGQRGGNAFGNSKKHSGGHHFGTSGKPHANKHGALRGLQRANEVAGSHGQKGRDNAAAHKSSHGDSDSE